MMSLSNIPSLHDMFAMTRSNIGILHGKRQVPITHPDPCHDLHWTPSLKVPTWPFFFTRHFGWVGTGWDKLNGCPAAVELWVLPCFVPIKTWCDPWNAKVGGILDETGVSGTDSYTFWCYFGYHESSSKRPPFKLQTRQTWPSAILRSGKSSSKIRGCSLSHEPC